MWKKLVCLALCLTLCALPAGAAGLSEGAMEEKAPMTLPCVSAMLLEPESGQIIFEVNADEKRPVASVVRIMTILLTVEAEEAGRLSLTDPVSISENAAGMGGSQVLLDPGETQTVDALLKSTIVGSANDAAVALAEHIAGSVPLFVDRMNERASRAGHEGHLVCQRDRPARRGTAHHRAGCGAHGGRAGEAPDLFPVLDRLAGRGRAQQRPNHHPDQHQPPHPAL